MTLPPDPSPVPVAAAVAGVSRARRWWLRLPILYKLWLALLPVQLLALVVPSMIFLEMLEQSRRDAYRLKWSTTAQNISTNKNLVANVDATTQLDDLWGELQSAGALGFHLGFPQSQNLDAAPRDEGAEDRPLASRARSSADPLDRGGPPDDSSPPVDPSPADANQGSPAESAPRPLPQIASLMEDDANDVLPPNLLQELSETGLQSSSEVEVQEVNSWVKSRGLCRPGQSPGELLRETDGFAASADQEENQRIIEQAEYDRFLVVTHSPRLQSGETLRAPDGRALEVVSVLAVDWAPLNARVRRTNLLAVLTLIVGAAILLLAIHFALSSLVVGPLGHLSRVMRRATPETLGSLRVAVTRADEIGDLQNALNLLAHEISTRQSELNRANDELEARVLQRTVELGQRNSELASVNGSLELAMKKLESANSELERSNYELDAFAYTVSHDLQAPLRNVSYIVSEEIPEAIQQQDAAVALKLAAEARGLCEFNIRMVGGLLDWSRIGRTQTNLEPVCLADIAAEVRQQQRSLLEERQATLTVADDLPTVRGDRMQLHRVLTNLVTNGVKYNDKADKRIEIGWARHPVQGPALFVRDNGIGIKPQHISKLFNLLVQVHDKTIYGEGIGMGLAIVKKIVESYNGAVWIESVYGEGSTFWVRLPLADLPGVST